MKNLKQITKSAVAFITTAILLSACGGGDGNLVTVGYDEEGNPIEVWIPTKTTETANNQTIVKYPFPLALHQKTILRSYASKVGTSSSSKTEITGTMTTPEVANGTYYAIGTTTRTYGSSVLFQGTSATPVTNNSNTTSITLNGKKLPDTSSTSISYYDTTYGFMVGSTGSSGSLTIIDTTNTIWYPALVNEGEAGDSLIYLTYSDSSKSNYLGKSVKSYKILSATANNSEEYSARVEWTTRNYNNTGVLLSQSTLVQDLIYSNSTGAKTITISNSSDDVYGTTTSHLTYKKL